MSNLYMWVHTIYYMQGGLLFLLKKIASILNLAMKLSSYVEGIPR